MKPKTSKQVEPAATPAVTEAKPKIAKVVDPQVAEAKAKLKAAHEAAKAAEAKAKEQRKAEREAKTAERKAAKAAPRPTCTGTKKDGTACTAKAKEGSELCVDHQPAVLRLTTDETKALKGWLGSMNRDALLATFVAEIGWFRAKQIVAQNGALSNSPKEVAVAA